MRRSTNIKETKSLSWQLNTPTRIWKWTRCIMQMTACTHQTLSKTFANSLNMQKQFEKMLGKRVMTRTVTDKSTYHEKPHFDLFFTTISTSKKMFFFRARAEKGIAWHIDTSSVVETLIYHGKLANQIARLAAIVVKNLMLHTIVKKSLFWKWV